MELRVFKPVDNDTAVVEFVENDQIVAEVFVGDGGVRQFYVSERFCERGLNWASLLALAPHVDAMLDRADAEMAAARKYIAELTKTDGS